MLLRLCCDMLRARNVQARLLAQLDHPFIIKHYSTFLSGADDLHIVMDFATRGTVYHAVRKAQQRLQEDTIWKWAIQLLLGVAFIHGRRIIHRDIKTLNLFLDANSDIKIGDFGIARALGDGTDMLRTVIGTPFYISALPLQRMSAYMMQPDNLRDCIAASVDQAVAIETTLLDSAHR